MYCNALCACAVFQTLASPLSGVLGDRYDRVLVLSSGAFIWGIMTSAMALTVTLHQVRDSSALTHATGHPVQQGAGVHLHQSRLVRPRPSC